MYMMIIRNTLLLLPMLWFLNMPSEAVKRRNRAPDVGIMDRIAKKLAMTEATSPSAGVSNMYAALKTIRKTSGETEDNHSANKKGHFMSDSISIRINIIPIGFPEYHPVKRASEWLRSTAWDRWL
eukprot:212017_1